MTKISKRMNAGNGTFFSYGLFNKFRNVKRSIKIRLYETIIHTVVAFGSEASTLKSRNCRNFGRLGKNGSAQNIRNCLVS